MEEFHQGQLLVAHPSMVDPTFARTVIYLVCHDESGAAGVILNRPTDVAVIDHLGDVADRASFPPVFFEGGPVEPGSVVAVGAVGTEPPEFADIDGLINGRVGVPPRLRFFAGHSGWAPGQLERELDEGTWFVAPTQRERFAGDDVFGAESTTLWRSVLRRQPGPVSQLALYPDDLIAN